MRKGRFPVLSSVLVAVIFSCGGGKPASTQATPSPSPVASPLRVELSSSERESRGSPESVPDVPTGGDSRSSSPRPSLTSSPSSRVEGEAPFLQHLRESVLATDTYIGPLPGRLAPSSPEEAARWTAQAFSTRRLPPEIQDEGVRQHVLRTLAYMDRLGVSVTGVRIGLAFPDASGLFHVNIKLYLQEGYVGGSVVLKKQDAGWVVSDLLLDTASFLSPETEERPFAPGGYAMLPLY
ncbi:hypothetical protein [Spirochaeta thermophila]|uniref:hypothetical protein n=1 Tax=Winmispira thermophila TaxID=154 RepID=UPI0005A2B821|nr:hypothetical protein [Spirochaeta thermophila]